MRVIDKGNGQADVSFGITMPMRVYEDFMDLCKREYGDCYWLAIKAGMDLQKSNYSKVEIDALWNAIEELSAKIEEKKDKVTPEEGEITLGK